MPGAKGYRFARSKKEIAAREGVSVGVIKTRVHRAKKEFKKISFSLI